MIMLKGARVIDPATRVDDILDILVSERKIVKIGKDLAWDAPLIARAKGERLEVVDCDGLIAAPGLVDVHVHLREPGLTYKEDIASGARAAASGGFTTIIAMANTKPAVDNEETLLEVLKQGRKACIKVKSCAAITKGMMGEELVDLKGLKDSGAAGFTDDGMPLMDERMAREAMRIARGLKMVLSFHEEDARYVKESGVNHGVVAEKLGLYGAESKAEYLMVERDCKLAGETGATICIQHISTKEAVEAVRRAKKKGIRVFAEAAPHHFTLTEEAVLQYGTLAKMNPPLRTEADRLAIIEGLKDGTIELIATDHAPHSAQEKAREYVNAPSGIIGLETSLALGIMNLVDKGYLNIVQLISKMSYEPAKLYNLEAGILKEDMPADIVVFDMNREWIFDKTESKSNNSPWFGKKMKGQVVLTLCEGDIVYDRR